MFPCGHAANPAHGFRLGENVTRALVKMKCPAPLQSHQIRGLDYGALFPVVQWLVKQVMTTREETGDTIRNLSEAQFNKEFELPQDAEFRQSRSRFMPFISGTLDSYGPKRRYRRHGEKKAEEVVHVETVLLEYGRGVKTSAAAAKKKSVAGKPGEADDGAAEEARYKEMMGAMDAAGAMENVSGASAGRLIGMQADEIHKAAEAYQAFHASQLSVEDQKSKGAQAAHAREMAALQSQVAKLQQQLAVAKESHGQWVQETESLQQQQAEKEKFIARCELEIGKLRQLENDGNKNDLAKLMKLVMLNETLKSQEVSLAPRLVRFSF